MLAALCVLTALPQLRLTSAQIAPGGEEESLEHCKKLRSDGVLSKLTHPANVEVLMDSWNYQNLLPNRSGAVWQQMDYDSNNPVGLTTNWIQQSNAPCQQSVQVCGFKAGTQNNWLITQLINRTVNGNKLRQVSVKIEFELRDCNIELNCQRTFNTHMYETSSIDSAGARSIENYQQVERVTPDDTSGMKVNETFDINFSTEHSSFYFAIQDETSCVVITRLTVFYHICPAENAELVIRPKTIAPIISRKSVPILVPATCVGNASPVTPVVKGPTVKCNEGGIWSTIPDLGCKCDPGYIPSVDGRQCEACPDGHYFSSYSGDCLQCPENSTSIHMYSDGTPTLDSCTCLDGYFVPKGSDNNGSCDTQTVTTTLKPKTPTNLNIVLPTTLILVGLSMVLIGGFYLYKRHKRRGRRYQVNDVAPWQNGEVEVREDEMANGSRVRTIGERPREIRQISTTSFDTSARTSVTSLKWNVAYFLYKIFGSIETSTPVVPPSHASPSVAPVVNDRSNYELGKVDDEFVYHSCDIDEELDDPDYVNIGGNVKAAV